MQSCDSVTIVIMIVAITAITSITRGSGHHTHPPSSRKTKSNHNHRVTVQPSKGRNPPSSPLPGSPLSQKNHRSRHRHPRTKQKAKPYGCLPTSTTKQNQKNTRIFPPSLTNQPTNQHLQSAPRNSPSSPSAHSSHHLTRIPHLTKKEKRKTIP